MKLWTPNNFTTEIRRTSCADLQLARRAVSGHPSAYTRCHAGAGRGQSCVFQTYIEYSQQIHQPPTRQPALPKHVQPRGVCPLCILVRFTPSPTHVANWRCRFGDSTLYSNPLYNGESAHHDSCYSPGYHPSSALGFAEAEREGDNQGRRCMSYLTTTAYGIRYAHTPRHSRCTSQDESIPDREDARVRRVWMWV